MESNTCSSTWKEFLSNTSKLPIQWCTRRDDLRPETLAVAGASRGGELALLVASTYPEIIAVVAWVGSGVIWGGMGGKVDEPVAAWTHNGQDLPFVRFDRKAINRDLLPVRFTPGFIAGMSDPTSIAAAEIPVERINGPVLLISGGDDQVWPSKMLGDIAVQRLRRTKHRFKGRTSVL